MEEKMHSKWKWYLSTSQKPKNSQEKGFEKDAVTITRVLFCHSAYSCSPRTPLLSCIILIALHLANIDFLPLKINLFNLEPYKI